MTELLLIPMGWIYLWVRYRSSAKVKSALQKDFDNQHYIAGAFVFWRILLISFMIGVFALILSTIYRTIIDF
ncbi:MAG: hypothetical protein ACYC1Q_10685 [Bacteroidia bacterium]